MSVPRQELKDLAAQLKDVSVTVGMDSRCRIDLSGIVEEVKAQYDAIAARSLEEAEAYSRSQVWCWQADWGDATRARWAAAEMAKAACSSGC